MLAPPPYIEKSCFLGWEKPESRGRWAGRLPDSVYTSVSHMSRSLLRFGLRWLNTIYLPGLVSALRLRFSIE